MHRTARTLVSTLTVLATVLIPYAASVPAAYATDTLLSESFGTGTGGLDIPSWDEDDGSGGSINDGTKVQAFGIGGADNSASPDGGRFALAHGGTPGNFYGGWFCYDVDAAGYDAIQLSYYWRGDSDSNTTAGKGYVEYKISGNCDDDPNGTGWTNLQMHTLMGNAATWQTQSAYSIPASDTNILIRFKAYTNASNKGFRVDGVSVTGDPIRRGSGEEPRGPFSVSINHGDEQTESRDVTLTLEAGGDTAYAKISEHWDFHDADWTPVDFGLASGSTTPLYLALLVVIGFASSGFWLSKFAAHKVHLVAVGLILGGLILSQGVAFGSSPTVDIPWQLSSGAGEKTIYVQFFTQYKEGGASSKMVSDSIIYEPEDIGVGGGGPAYPTPTAFITPNPPKATPVIRRPAVSPVVSPRVSPVVSTPAYPTEAPFVETDEGGGFWQWLLNLFKGN